MQLAPLLEEYLSLNLRIRHEHTRQQYRNALRRFADFLGHVPVTDDLRDDNISRFLLWLVDIRATSAVTANDRRIYIHALWNWIARRGHLNRWPTTPRLEVPDSYPEAWTREQLARLLDTCRSYKGTIRGVPLALWWMTFHLVLWDTGERTSAALSLRWEWLDIVSGRMKVPASVRKGKRKPALYTLTEPTLLLLREFRRDSGEIFPCGKSRSSFYHRYGRLLRKAGLPCDRTCKPQKMRRSYASWIAALGGNATAALMHDSPATTIKHYLDPTIVTKPPENRVLFRLDGAAPQPHLPPPLD